MPSNAILTTFYIEKAGTKLVKRVLYYQWLLLAICVDIDMVVITGSGRQSSYSSMQSNEDSKN